MPEWPENDTSSSGFLDSVLRYSHYMVRSHLWLDLFERYLIAGLMDACDGLLMPS